MVPKGNCSWPRLEVVTVKQSPAAFCLAAGFQIARAGGEHERRVEAMPCSGSPAIARSLEV